MKITAIDSFTLRVPTAETMRIGQLAAAVTRLLLSHLATARREGASA